MAKLKISIAENSEEHLIKPPTYPYFIFFDEMISMIDLYYISSLIFSHPPSLGPSHLAHECRSFDLSWDKRFHFRKFPTGTVTVGLTIKEGKKHQILWNILWLEIWPEIRDIHCLGGLAKDVFRVKKIYYF